MDDELIKRSFPRAWEMEAEENEGGDKKRDAPSRLPGYKLFGLEKLFRALLISALVHQLVCFQLTAKFAMALFRDRRGGGRTLRIS